LLSIFAHCINHRVRSLLQPIEAQNRAPKKEARVRTADVVKAKRLNCRTGETERKRKREKPLADEPSPGSAPLHWFKLASGINGQSFPSGGRRTGPCHLFRCSP